MVNHLCGECLVKLPTYLFTNIGISNICRLCEGKKEVNEARSETEACRQTIERLERRVEELSGIPDIVVQLNDTNNNESSVDSISERRNNIARRDSTEFTRVTNGVQPRGRDPVQPTKITNKFSLLPGLAEEDNNDVILVGDSLTRGLLSSFCARDVKRRSRFTYPGARVNTIRSNIEHFSAGTDQDATYVVHVGTNDVGRRNINRKEILNSFRTLIKDLKTKSNKILISGILPRLDGEDKFLNDSFNLNRELKWLCEEENVAFINTWNSFYNISDMYVQDRLHLSELGSIRLGRMLNDAVKTFFR
jgi:hypothetical protein